MCTEAVYQQLRTVEASSEDEARKMVMGRWGEASPQEEPTFVRWHWHTMWEVEQD